jgi:hypothetical protein
LILNCLPFCEKCFLGWHNCWYLCSCTFIANKKVCPFNWLSLNFTEVINIIIYMLILFQICWNKEKWWRLFYIANHNRWNYNRHATNLWSYCSCKSLMLLKLSWIFIWLQIYYGIGVLSFFVSLHNDNVLLTIA